VVIAMATLKAMASLDLCLFLSRCRHSYRICLNPATKVISFTQYSMGGVVEVVVESRLASSAEHSLPASW
jgi:hypothetical protein